MISKLKTIRVSILAGLALLSSCVSGPHFYMQYGNEYREIELDKLLAENPLAPGENIKVVNLGRSASASQHVVQIRDREIPHVHNLHDVTVTMMGGQGDLILDKNRINLKAGDVAHIPRGAVHYFVNTDRKPSVVMAVYAPAYDGKDTQPVKQP